MRYLLVITSMVVLASVALAQNDSTITARIDTLSFRLARIEGASEITLQYLDSLNKSLNKQVVKQRKKLDWAYVLTGIISGVVAYDYYTTYKNIDDLDYVDESAKQRALSSCRIRIWIFSGISFAAFYSVENKGITMGD